MATVSMMISVGRLEDASQTVRLALGSSEDGSRNGKRLRPAVAMTPAMAAELAERERRARPREPAKAAAIARAPATPRIGRDHVQGAMA